MCAGAIALARYLVRIWSEGPQSRSGRFGFDLVRRKELNHRVDVTSGVLEEECRAVIQRFSGNCGRISRGEVTSG